MSWANAIQQYLGPLPCTSLPFNVQQSRRATFENDKGLSRCCIQVLSMSTSAVWKSCSSAVLAPSSNACQLLTVQHSPVGVSITLQQAICSWNGKMYTVPPADQRYILLAYLVHRHR